MYKLRRPYEDITLDSGRRLELQSAMCSCDSLCTMVSLAMSYCLITTKVKSIQLLIALQEKDNRETLAARQRAKKLSTG